jgi:HPr kinase/phosphorylase
MGRGGSTPANRSTPLPARAQCAQADLPHKGGGVWSKLARSRCPHGFSPSSASPVSGAPRPTIHASAVLVGARAVLIRGQAGCGKSRLALALLDAAAQGRRFARLVTDDRAELEARSGRLLVRPPAPIQGLIEIRGLGIRRLPFEPVAVVGLVVDLDAPDAERLPLPQSREIRLEGIALPRLAVASGADPLALVLAATARPDPGF